MLIVLYTRKRHGRHERFDKGARTSTSADNDFQRSHERISNLQFRITLFVKIAVNLMLFFLIVVSQARYLKTSHVCDSRVLQTSLVIPPGRGGYRKAIIYGKLGLGNRSVTHISVNSSGQDMFYLASYKT